MGRHSHHAQPPAPQPGPRSHRGRRRSHPARTGLLASSAVLTVGAVAASSGLLGQLGDGLRHAAGGDGPTAQADGPGPATVDGDAPSPMGATTTPAAAAPTTGTGGSPSGTGTATPGSSATPARATASAHPVPTPTRTSAAPTAPVTTPATLRSATSTTTAATGEAAAARTQILALVNEQRATAGCRPLTASSALDTLAQDFSDDMAARGFFSHTDPDGNTPWDRAKSLGITNLGGENIAMGQADAQAVMDAWMNSAGHRANILNCDFTTLGVGVHFGTGGPWWTQDFGY